MPRHYGFDGQPLPRHERDPLEPGKRVFVFYGDSFHVAGVSVKEHIAVRGVTDALHVRLDGAAHTELNGLAFPELEVRDVPSVVLHHDGHDGLVLGGTGEGFSGQRD